MFKKYFEIKIDKPCTENWENMQPSDRGRFCNSCSKQVLDFTEMSDSDILLFFKKHQNVCGRFYEDQLQRNLLPYVQKQSLFKKAIAAVALLFQAFHSEAQTQNSKPQPVVVQEESIHDSLNSITPVCSKSIPGDSRTVKTKLMVMDSETYNGIEEVIILFEGDTLECTTNSAGEIIFELPDRFQNCIVNLKISKAGYITHNQNLILDGNFIIIILQKIFIPKRSVTIGAIRGNSSPLQSEINFVPRLFQYIPNLFREF